MKCLQDLIHKTAKSHWSNASESANPGTIQTMTSAEKSHMIENLTNRIYDNLKDELNKKRHRKHKENKAGKKIQHYNQLSSKRQAKKHSQTINTMRKSKAQSKERIKIENARWSKFKSEWHRHDRTNDAQRRRKIGLDYLMVKPNESEVDRPHSSWMATNV